MTGSMVLERNSVLKLQNYEEYIIARSFLFVTYTMKYAKTLKGLYERILNLICINFLPIKNPFIFLNIDTHDIVETIRNRP